MCIENASEHSLLRIYGRINRLYYEINTPDFWTDGDEDKKCKMCSTSAAAKQSAE